MPYRVMREIWEGSSYLSGPWEGLNWSRCDVSSLAMGWWGIFLLWGILGYILWLTDDPRLWLPGSMVTLVTIGVTLGLVDRISDMQEQGRSLREAVAVEAARAAAAAGTAEVAGAAEVGRATDSAGGEEDS